MNNFIIVLSFFKILTVLSQDNAGTNVAPALIECYKKQENLLRENRPESTMIQLIEFIRKIESSSSLQNDRELSKEIIHRFKQDGISRQKNVIESKYSIPYSPTDYQTYKNRVLLRVLVPGSTEIFPNDTLSELEGCSLHFMLSTSIDSTKRDDEAITCKKFSQYVRRVRRDVDPKNQVETFDPVRASPFPFKGKIQDGNNRNIESILLPNTGVRTFSGREEISDCPIENGVVYTKWGAVSPGIVIAGIAAGRTPQEITDRGRTILNVYAATIVGDLSEVALQQGSRGKDPVSVGASGGWNDIEVIQTFYLEKAEPNTNYELTDAEIRGGLDGFILGVNMKEWHSKVPSLKISQILDMYYSPRGVFSKKYRACNRNKIFAEIAPLEKLTEQAVAYSYMLKETTELQGTIYGDGIETCSQQACKALYDYTASKLIDVSCAADDGNIERIFTDIIIAVDSAWEYSIAKKTLKYLIRNLDINEYGSLYTVVNGYDAGTLVKTSQYITDLDLQYTSQKHYIAPKGSNTVKILQVVGELIKEKMSNDKSNKKAGGRSYILLFLKYDPLSDAERLNVNVEKQNIQKLIPDLKLLVLGHNSKMAYEDLVFNPAYDSFVLAETAIAESVKPLIERIRQVPRRITNPNCGSNWDGDSSALESFDEYVEPYGINFYRVATNYLYGEETKTIKIKGYGYGNLVACASRTNSRPLNSTQDNVKCETITSNNEVAFNLENPCKGYSTPLDCLPAYFSVQAQMSGSESTIFRCIETSCRFPDNIKYTISVDKLGCYSASKIYLPTTTIMFLAPLIAVGYGYIV